MATKMFQTHNFPAPAQILAISPKGPGSFWWRMSCVQKPRSVHQVCSLPLEYYCYQAVQQMELENVYTYSHTRLYLYKHLYKYTFVVISVSDYVSVVNSIFQQDTRGFIPASLFSIFVPGFFNSEESNSHRPQNNYLTVQSPCMWQSAGLPACLGALIAQVLTLQGCCPFHCPPCMRPGPCWVGFLSQCPPDLGPGSLEAGFLPCLQCSPCAAAGWSSCSAALLCVNTGPASDAFLAQSPVVVGKCKIIKEQTLAIYSPCSEHGF